MRPRPRPRLRPAPPLGVRVGARAPLPGPQPWKRPASPQRPCKPCPRPCAPSKVAGPLRPRPLPPLRTGLLHARPAHTDRSLGSSHCTKGDRKSIWISGSLSGSQQHGRSTRYSPLILTRRLRAIDSHQHVRNSNHRLCALPRSPQGPQSDVRRRASNLVKHQWPNGSRSLAWVPA